MAFPRKTYLIPHESIKRCVSGPAPLALFLKRWGMPTSGSFGARKQMPKFLIYLKSSYGGLVAEGRRGMLWLFVCGSILGREFCRRMSFDTGFGACMQNRFDTTKVFPGFPNKVLVQEMQHGMGGQGALRSIFHRLR